MAFKAEKHHPISVLAGDGKEGLIAARQTLPDLILLDMMLLIMSGIEVLLALKMGCTKDTIFVLTGLSQKNEDKLLNAGAAKYFEKSEHCLEHNFKVLVEAVGRCNT
jgi:DNA-binding response OmpR family regulator